MKGNRYILDCLFVLYYPNKYIDTKSDTKSRIKSSKRIGTYINIYIFCVGAQSRKIEELFVASGEIKARNHANKYSLEHRQTF